MIVREVPFFNKVFINEIAYVIGENEPFTGKLICRYPTDILKEEEKLIFKGWGSFEVKEVKERIFNNPRTKKSEKIPATNKIVFKQGKILKRKFNEKV